jgi:uncharacterized repeat protein (TIGR03803 family)
MHSAGTNGRTKSSLKTSMSRFVSKRLAAAIAPGALTLAVLSALLLIVMAARPAQAQTETVLHSFCYYANPCPQDNTDGFFPESSLASDGQGNFYGTTYLGGSFGVTGYTDGGGIVFEISPTGSGSWNETVLYSFCSAPNCADGATPYYSNVILDSGGNLYGTTQGGGAYGFGVVFELSPAEGGWTETVLHSFGPQGEDGMYPVNGLVMDPAGNLYGMTIYGSVFEVSPSGGGWTEQVIYVGGPSSYGGLALDGTGNIFGLSSVGVFELSPNGNGSWTTTVIHTFPGVPKDGSQPNGTPVCDQAGNVYGTTLSGGAKDYGTVYELTPVTTGKKKGTWKEKILYSFNGGKKDGSFPWAGVVLDASGNIYGTTEFGGKYACGASGCGTVFELLAPGGTGGYKEKVLWSFNGTDGYAPVGNLILDGAGNVYGTTIEGGSTYGAPGVGDGLVFEVNPAAAATAIALSSSPNPSTYGQAVTFTAVLAPAPPDGETISFMKGKALLGTGTLSGGSADFTTTTLKVGTTIVTAVYGGDFEFLGSTSNTVKQVVEKAMN